MGISASVKRALARAIASNSASVVAYRKLLFDPVLLGEVLKDEAVAPALARDPRFGAGRPEIFWNAMGSAARAELALKDRALLRQLLERGLLEEAVADAELLARILSDDRAVARVLEDDRFFERYFAAEAPFARLAGDARFFRRLLGDDALLGRIAREPRFIDAAFADDANLVRLLGDARLYDKIAGHAPSLKRVLADGRALEAVHADPNFAARFVFAARSIDRILSEAPALKKIVQDPRLAEALFADEAALGRIVKDERLLAPWRKLDDRRLELFLFDEALESRPALHARLEGAAEMRRQWADLQRVIAGGPEAEARFASALARVRKVAHVHNLILEAAAEGHEIRLKHGTLEFIEPASLWTLLHEILLREEYWFEAEGDSPRVLDCGAHCGFAIYYFKTLYPNARVIAFEPVPSTFEIARRNVARCGFADVELLPFAILDKAGTEKFYLPVKDSMGGSLLAAEREDHMQTEEIEVRCARLGEYLREPVDFLKLDIEGAEDRVIADIEPELGNVRQLFIEYHQRPGLGSGRLAAILSVLARAGFEFHVGKAFNTARETAHQPMRHAAHGYSAGIWARRPRR